MKTQITRKSGLLVAVTIGLFIFAAIHSAGAVIFQADVAGINGFTKVDKISWTDSRGLVREAYMAKEYSGQATAKGYITRFVYHTSGNETVTADEPSVASDRSGLGQSLNFTGQWTTSYSSQKKEGSNFNQRVIFQGQNHLIYEVTFTQGTTNHAVTVHWCFYEGLDYFLYAITYKGGSTGDDTRGPYSEINWDGYSDMLNPLNGQSWGTDKLFTAPNMSLTDPNSSSWTFGAANLVPFTHEWLLSPSREMGLVQTQLQSRHAGGCYTSNYITQGIGGTTFATNGHWIDFPYYMNAQGAVNNGDLWTGNNISWGTAVGSVNPNQYYTIAMLLDAYSDHGVDSLLRETERVTRNVTLTASVGTVPTSGKTASGLTTTSTYYPSGYDHVYRAWRATASNNSATIGFNISTGSVNHPVFVVGSAGGSASSVTLNGTPLAAGSGYFASYNAAQSETWVTVMSKLSGNNTIAIATLGTGTTMQPLSRQITRQLNSSVLPTYSLQGRLIGKASGLSQRNSHHLSVNENGIVGTVAP